MGNILIISENKSFLITSMQAKLEELGHRVYVAGNDVSEIDKITVDLQMMIFFAEEKIVADKKILVYLRDRVDEEDFVIFSIGDREELDEFARAIPKQFIKKELVRPINTNELVESVDTFLKDAENHPKKKILVVDDSGAMLRNVKSWLEDRYQVILANSGAMAIKYLATNHPDLILLDYEMPVCDGKQVLEMIRSEMEFSDVPVFFLTGKNDKESVLSVSSLKPQGYLLKTMEPEKIVAIIDDYFEKQ
ncbi:MAG: response regulator [Lachnospiraceae bacterium]|nr:response regulator [Lachnospiraceae bacterium]